MNDEGPVAALTAEDAEVDDYAWIPDGEVSVSSVRAVVEAFARRPAPAVSREESERV